MHAYADHSKVQQVFKIQSGYTLKEGLVKMAAWAKTAGSRKSGKFEGIEITEKLPAVWLED
jgi:UDP-glucose 4-epimerase